MYILFELLLSAWSKIPCSYIRTLSLTFCDIPVRLKMEKCPVIVSLVSSFQQPDSSQSLQCYSNNNNNNNNNSGCTNDCTIGSTIGCRSFGGALARASVDGWTHLVLNWMLEWYKNQSCWEQLGYSGKS